MDKIRKLNIQNILEGKEVNEDTVKLKPTKVGTWIGDELIVLTWPIKEFINRVATVGYDFSGAKQMEAKLRKMLPDMIKNDKEFSRSVIDIMGDPDVSWEEKADMIDNNVDEFIDGHPKELNQFISYRR